MEESCGATFAGGPIALFNRDRERSQIRAPEHDYMTVLAALIPTRARRLHRIGCVFALLTLASLGAACAPETETFEARLTPFPVIGGNTGGMGQATATLTGTTLEVSGSYTGLNFRAGRGGDLTPVSATSARLHAGPVTAVSGDAFADLTLTSEGTGDTGTISGSLDLTAEQVDMLRNGQVYAQIDTEEATGGQLWGWFLQ